jgi:hypothetical protein
MVLISNTIGIEYKIKHFGFLNKTVPVYDTYEIQGFQNGLVCRFWFYARYLSHTGTVFPSGGRNSGVIYDSYRM